MKRGLLYGAVAVLTLAAQVAVAVHAPWHHEEELSSCGDTSSHWCPERPAPHAGTCVLCRASLDGPAIVPARAPVLAVEAGTATPPVQAGRSPAVLSPWAPPRAPPVG